MWQVIIGAASFFFRIGVQVSGITSLPLGLWLMGLVAALHAGAIYIFILERRKNSKLTYVPTLQSSSSKPRVRPFSDDEVLHYRSVQAKVIWNHGHDDGVGLREDIWDAQPLDGPCHICGIRRIDQGAAVGRI